MKLALASDHAGFVLKDYLVQYLTSRGHDILDLGVESDQVRADYPDAAAAVAHAVLNGQTERGIIICGSGIGACIAANKFHGIYAAIAHDTYSAAQGVEHDPRVFAVEDAGQSTIGVGPRQGRQHQCPVRDALRPRDGDGRGQFPARVRKNLEAVGVGESGHRS